MISVFGSKVDEQEINSVSAVLQSQWLGFGSKVAEFEKKFAETNGIENFIMVDTGSNALLMAVKLLNLPAGSEVILPTFTWVSCAQAILLAGCVPVFCDVDINTMNVSRDNIEPLITPKTGAIMVVHYAGKAVDIDPILALGLPVIEDAAHAVNTFYKGKLCGTMGDVGIYSFGAVKNLTTGEGGGVTTKNKELIERAKMLRYCGIGKSGFDTAVANSENKSRWWEYNITEPFIKMLPTNITASIGIEQLAKLDQLQAFRRMVWERYQQAFKDIPWIITPVDAAEDETHSYFTYAIRVDNRDSLAHYLLKNDIYTTLRYHPLHLNKVYGEAASLPNAEQLNEDTLNLPLHPNLTIEQVEYIIDKVTAFKEELSA
jgi:dTDP-4-amino-4,6-dideoxygalactose transaminase